MESDFGGARGPAGLDGDLAVVSRDDVVDVLARNTEGIWLPSATLTPSDGTPDDQFGDALDMEGGIAVVGAPGALNNSRGAAYVFTRTESGDWVEEAKLTAATGAQGDRFGAAISLSGSTALIGAPRSSSESGSAYIFERSPDGTWAEISKLSIADLSAGEDFGLGNAVSIVGDLAVVGAQYAERSGGRDGLAYAFQKENGQWGLGVQLPNWEDQNGFGRSVAVMGDSSLWGIVRGNAYVFDPDGNGGWQSAGKLPEPHGVSKFGSYLASDGEILAVSDRARAHVFERVQSGEWNHTGLLKTRDGDASIGMRVAAGGKIVFMISSNNSRVYAARPSAAYANWIGDYDLSDTNIDGDPDEDGISNADEWDIGTNPEVPDQPYRLIRTFELSEVPSKRLEMLAFDPTSGHLISPTTAYLKMFDTAGLLIEKIPFPSAEEQPRGLEVLPNGHFLIAGGLPRPSFLLEVDRLGRPVGGGISERE